MHSWPACKAPQRGTLEHRGLGAPELRAPDLRASASSAHEPHAFMSSVALSSRASAAAASPPPAATNARAFSYAWTARAAGESDWSTASRIVRLRDRCSKKDHVLKLTNHDGSCWPRLPPPKVQEEHD
jgi:hypothetical protein